MDKVREEFEAWASSEFGTNLPTEHHDAYRNVKEFSWKVWKASRAAICVELPIQYQAPLVDEPAMDADEVRWALEESGVPYK